MAHGFYGLSIFYFINLSFLTQGFKSTLSKLRFYQSTVNYLGFTLSPRQCQHSNDHHQGIQDVLPPKTSLACPWLSVPLLIIHPWLWLNVTDPRLTAVGVLAQEYSSSYHPVAYLSAFMAVATWALMVQAAEIVLWHPLALHTSHQVHTILHNCSTQHTTAQCHSAYEVHLLHLLYTPCWLPWSFSTLH